MIQVCHAVSQEEIDACYPIMAQLRPHLDRDSFRTRVQQQMQSGYHLAYLRDGQIRAAAGYRMSENLAWGRFLYVDDLVTDEACRSQGYGKQLLDWLKENARSLGCQQLHLDSGMQRLQAHSFYERQQMKKTGYHFAHNFA